MSERGLRHGGVSEGGWLVGVLGAALSLILLALAAPYCPPLIVPALSGLFGVLLVPSRQKLGWALILVGCLPFLALLLLAIRYGSLVFGFVLVLSLPVLLMLWGAAGIAGMAGTQREEMIALEVTFRCARCRVKFTPYPNPWHNAGYCSRKCLLCSR